MYNVCFDFNDNIIGFNLINSLYHVNLFYLHDIKKIVQKIEKIHAQDSLGRKLYQDLNDNKIVSYKINENSIPYMIDKIFNKELYLEYDSNEFNLNDILEIKYNQLSEKFNCDYCILDEFLSDQNLFNFNATSGKNLMIINNDAISQEINLENYSDFAVYCESTNDVLLEISYDNKSFQKISKETFIKKENNSIYIKIIAPQKTNIYSFALLLK